MPLEEAIDMAVRLFRGDGMNAVDREVAAGHIGYRGLNGASAQALASLIQYGLLETSGKGQVRLTGLALDIIEPQGDAEKAESLQRAAWAPRLFSELRERFPSATPSEANLRAYLLRQHFQPAALKTVIPAYLKTCEYLAQEGASESYGQPVTQVAASPAAKQLREPQPVDFQPHTRSTAPPTPPTVEQAPLGTRREVFALDEGEVVITLPNRLSADSIEDVDAWLEIVARKLRRMAKAPGSPTPPENRDATATSPHEGEDEPD